MATKVVWCLLFAFFIQSRADSQWSCRNPKCHCTFEPTSTESTWQCYHKKPSGQILRGESLSILLPDGSVRLEPSFQMGRSDPEGNSLIPLDIHFKENENLLEIDCGHFTSEKVSDLNSSLYDSVPKLNLVHPKPILVRLKLCPFPDESFESFLRILNVTNVDSLQITDSASPVTLSPSYFNGLPSLESISLTDNSGFGKLPADLFKETLALRHLFLRGNKITQLDVATFRSLNRLEILDLGKNELAELDPGIFHNLSALKTLNIDYNPLVNLTRALFANVPSLLTLDISGNNISVLEPHVFDDLVKLQKLHAHKTRFQTFPADLFSKTKELQRVKVFYSKDTLVKLPSGLFSNLPKLTMVDIRESAIEELPSDLFRNSTKLETLSLTGHRKLRTISAELFRDCKHVTRLDLSNNGLESLPENGFRLLEKLTDLNLRGNRLENITQYVFKGLTNLNKLNLNHNKLKFIGPTSFDSLIDLTEIDLSNNVLEFDADFSHSPLKPCVNLQVLNLSHNRISRIYQDWRITFTRLKELDLSWNKFTIIRDVLHSIVSSKMVMDLSHNQISIVKLNTLEYMADQQEAFGEPNTIILSDNPITCNCSNYDLIRALQKTMSPNVSKMIQFETSDVTCDPAYPKRTLNRVRPEQLKCPVPECPAPCTCTFSPHDTRMTVNCSSTRLTEVPRTLPTEYESAKASNIELILSNNLIRELPSNVSNKYARFVTELDLSHNKVSNGEEFIRRLPKLKKLDLTSNQFESLSESFVNLSKASNISNLYLADNPWQCDCGITQLYRFLKHPIVMDSNQILCDGRALLGMSTDDFCPSLSPFGLAIIVLGSLGVLFGLFMAFYFKFEHEIKLWLYTHNWLLFWVSENDIDTDKLFDVFLSYCQQNYGFVVRTLLPELEKMYTVCHHERDFVGGNMIVDEIHEKVRQSRRTIILLTEDFVKSRWGMEEFYTAYAQAAADKCPRIIMVVYGELPPLDSMAEKMRSYLNTHTYIKWDGNEKRFWNRIRYAMPHYPGKERANEMPLVKCRREGDVQATTQPITDEEKETQPKHYKPIMKKG